MMLVTRIFAVVIFLCPVLSGAADHPSSNGGKSSDPVGLTMSILERKLGLSGETREQVTAIVEDHIRQEADFAVMEAPDKPERQKRYNDGRRRMRERIMPLLSPEQKLAAAVNARTFRICRQLELTPEQMTRIAELALRHKDAEQDLNLIVWDDDRQRHEAYQRLTRGNMQELRAVLTPEQQARYDLLRVQPANPVLLQDMRSSGR